MTETIGTPYRVAAAPFPTHRADAAHKGSCGRVLIVAGSRGMCGAAALCGKAALRGGAGLVTIATASSAVGVVAGLEPSYLTVGLPEDGHGSLGESAESLIDALAENQDVLAIGPGCGQTPAVSELLVNLFTELPHPMVVDADALNALARTPRNWQQPNSSRGPRVLTPHLGEFSRLVGLSVSEILRDRETIAMQSAARWSVVLLLKGPRTLVTDGRQLYENTTGNSGMATGGTGDVLTGLIAALIAQGQSPFEAAAFGASLHGLAGDLAAEDLSKPGLIASDLPGYLAKAWKKLGY